VFESRGTTTVVVPELGGTTTVVALSDRGGLLLTQPQSTALRISKLDMTFIFVSSFNRQVAFSAADCRRKSVMPDMGLSRTCHTLIARVYVVVRPTLQVRTVSRLGHIRLCAVPYGSRSCIRLA
jgi:hypothetical protein